MCPLAMTMADGGSREIEIYLHHKDGHRAPVSVRASALTDENGNIIGGVELFTDISNRRSNELRVKELEEMALLDNLTRLANRHYIEKDISLCFEEKKRLGVYFGILFMDIDHFKKFNDKYGHEVGDRVLKFVADTLVKNSRPFDVIGRWGGEEFIGVIRNVTDRLHVKISIGATLVRDDDNMDTVIKRADSLLYESKKAGRNRLTMG
jgi:GGDEF domain-containing protein